MSASDQKKRNKSGPKAAIPAAASNDESQVDDPASPLASVTQPTQLDPASIQHLSSLLQELTITITERQNELKNDVKELVNRHIIQLESVSTRDQHADFLTKAVSFDKLQYHHRSISGYSPSSSNS